MFFLTALAPWLWGEPIHFKLSSAIIYLIGGVLVGLTTWWMGDARYQSHISDKKIHDGFKR